LANRGLRNIKKVPAARRSRSGSSSEKGESPWDAIRANQVLSKLQASSKRKLIAGATFQELEGGATICHQDALAVRFWLVLEGGVKLVKYTSTGYALLIDLILPNHPGHLPTPEPNPSLLFGQQKARGLQQVMGGLNLGVNRNCKKNECRA
jgi:hypothetical protein